MSRGHRRLTVRLDPRLRDRAKAKARAEGIQVSEMLREALETWMEDVGPAVMIRLTPYYRAQLVRRPGNYQGQAPAAVLERFMQLALDGAWLLTDHEA